MLRKDAPQKLGTHEVDTEDQKFKVILRNIVHLSYTVQYIGDHFKSRERHKVFSLCYAAAASGAVSVISPGSHTLVTLT